MQNTHRFAPFSPIRSQRHIAERRASPQPHKGKSGGVGKLSRDAIMAEFALGVLATLAFIFACWAFSAPMKS